MASRRLAAALLGGAATLGLLAAVAPTAAHASLVLQLQM